MSSSQCPKGNFLELLKSATMALNSSCPRCFASRLSHLLQSVAIHNKSVFYEIGHLNTSKGILQVTHTQFTSVFLVPKASRLIPMPCSRHSFTTLQCVWTRYASTGRTFANSHTILFQEVSYHFVFHPEHFSAPPQMQVLCAPLIR